MLSFDTIYRVVPSYDDKPHIRLGFIVLGVVQEESTGLKPDYFKFCMNSESHFDWGFPGWVTLDEGEKVVIHDARQLDNEVDYTFEPLTLERWREMGEAGDISGYDVLKEQIKSDDILWRFYRENYLGDYWLELHAAVARS